MNEDELPQGEEEEGQEENVYVPLDIDAYVQETNFKQEVDKHTIARLIAEAAEKRLNEKKYPFAAKMAEIGLEDALASYETAKANKYRYLVKRFMPEKSYGVLFAEYKAGKTWITIDIAVTALLGVRMLNLFEFETKPKIAIFIGEGDAQEFWRRFEAVLAFYAPDITVKTLLMSGRLLVQFRPPNVSSPDEMQKVHTKLAAFKPDLTILDPWYLSGGEDADSKNLTAMGMVLRNIQGVCQDVGSALLVMHHWNQTGTGSGFGRGSGAGLQEWGRILYNLSILKETKSDPDDETGKTTVKLKLEMKGQVNGEYSFTREVWSDDKNDLSSPMHYNLVPEKVSQSIPDDEETLEWIILNAAWNALRENSGKWNKTELSEEVSKKIQKRKQDVLKVTSFMQRHTLWAYEIQAGNDPSNPTKSDRKVIAYPGDEFVNTKREAIKVGGLNAEWQVFRIKEEKK